METKDDGAVWRWVAVGCGGLVLLSLCLISPIAAFWLLRSESVPDNVYEPAPRDEELPAPPHPLPPTPLPTPTPVPPPPDTPSEAPRQIVATVEEAEGLAGIAAGTECRFPVTREPRPDGTFWCNAQVRCGSQLLYGGANAGYFDCTLYEGTERHVVGEDANTTAVDQDAAMRLDTLRHELTVRDDARGRLGAFTLRARVTAIE